MMIYVVRNDDKNDDDDDDDDVSAGASWRSSPAAGWATCSASSTPTPSLAAAAPSSPGTLAGKGVNDIPRLVVKIFGNK